MAARESAGDEVGAAMRMLWMQRRLQVNRAVVECALEMKWHIPQTLRESRKSEDGDLVCCHAEHLATLLGLLGVVQAFDEEYPRP